MTQDTTIRSLGRSLFAGFGISFLGSLPLGTMNITATHIAVADGVNNAFIYALGSMLAEVIIVRTTLSAVNRLFSRIKLLNILEWFTVVLLLVLAVASIMAAIRMQGFREAAPIHYAHPFWTGILLSVTNPLHLPFWLGWSTVLINKKILLPNPGAYNFYVTGIGLGTILGFTVFIFGGIYFIEKIQEHQQALNWVIGIVLLTTAIIQVIKIRRAPVSERFGRMFQSN